MKRLITLVDQCARRELGSLNDGYFYSGKGDITYLGRVDSKYIFEVITARMRNDHFRANYYFVSDGKTVRLTYGVNEYNAIRQTLEMNPGLF